MNSEHFFYSALKSLTKSGRPLTINATASKTKQSTRRNALTLICFAGICSAASIPIMSTVATAQVSSTVTITGTVTDSTGAVVPNANVTITSQSTSAITEAKSNASGNFNATGLPAGDYTVKVTSAGFETFVANGLTMRSGETRTVNAALSLGTSTQEVTVQETAANVETSTSELSSTVDAKQVAEVPLNGRNFEGLAALMPGVINTSAGSALGTGGNTTMNAVSVNGFGPGAGVTYFLDGIWDANVSSGNQLSITPNPDMIQEVRVLQDNYDVKYSLVGGSAIVIETKSGTSKLHGTVFEYLRNTDLNARKAFATTTPHYNQNIFGYALGGPVFIPKLYAKKDRTFFFASEQWLRQVIGQTVTGIVPTTDNLNGYFTTSITDPTTGLPFAQSSPGVYQIPTGRINTNAQILLKALDPAPNTAGVQNYTNTLPIRTNQRDDEFRIDHNLTANGKFRLSAAYYAEHQTSVQETTTHAGSNAAGTTAPIYPSAAQEYATPDQVAKVELTTQITPNMVNQARVTVNVYISELMFAPNATWLLSQVPGFSQSLPFANGDLRLPYITFGNGFPSIGDVAGTLPPSAGGRNSDLDRAVADDWSWSHGKHFLQAGFTYMVNTKRQTSASVGFPNATWNFSGRYTGNSIADFLLGDANTFSQYVQSPRILFRAPWSSYYVGDQWKISPKLTLTYGLRASFMPLVSTPQGDAPVFLPSLYSSTQAPTVQTNGQITTTSSYNALNGIALNGENGQALNNRAPGERQWYLLPQVGFAFDPKGDGKTSFRGGYSMTTPRNISILGALCCQANPPLTQNVNLSSVSFPNPTNGTTVKTVTALSTLDPHLQSGQVHTFSLSGQHEFPGNWVASIAGSGTLVRHLADSININQPLPTGGYDFNPAINSGTNAYYYAPYQGYGAISSQTSNDTASYFAEMASLKHPLGHGVFLTAAYTWSHAITNFRSTTLFATGGGQQNPYNIRAEKGNSQVNIPQVFNATVLYDLPSFANPQGWAGKLIDGWKLDEVATAETGASLDPALSVSNQGLATLPDQIGAISYPKQRTQWFSVSSFAKPAAGHYGDSHTGIIRGPGLINFDTGLYKDFAINSRHVFQFRAEAFNTFNHTNYSTVNTTYGSSAFGYLTGARDARVIEVAGRYRF